MRPVLIQNQTPSKVIYDGVIYNTIGKFITEQKVFDVKKRKLLYKFLWNNFRTVYKDGVYNIDGADEYFLEKMKSYLKGFTHTVKHCSTPVKYKDKLYTSISRLAEELNIRKETLLDILHKNNKTDFKKLKVLTIKKTKEKQIERKIEMIEKRKKRKEVNIIFNDFFFKNLSDLAKFINYPIGNIRSFINFKKIKLDEEKVDLNLPKYKLLKEYIQKKDTGKKLKKSLNLEEQVKNFAKGKDIPIEKILLFIKERNITEIEEVKRFYQYRI